MHPSLLREGSPGSLSETPPPPPQLCAAGMPRHLQFLAGGIPLLPLSGGMPGTPLSSQNPSQHWCRGHIPPAPCRRHSCAPLNSCRRSLLSPMRGCPGAEARERDLKEGTGEPHIPSAASPRDPTSLQLPGPQRPGWRVLSIPARAACHHAWLSVTRSTSSAPGPWERGVLAASLQPWRFPGGARNRGDSSRGHPAMRGSSRGQTGRAGASPRIPRWVLCAGGVETARLRGSAEIQHRRRHGCDIPIPLSPSGTGGRIRIRVLGGHARTRAGRRRNCGLGGADPRNTRLGGCVGCRHAHVSVHGASLFPVSSWGAVTPRQDAQVAASRALQQREPAAGAAGSAPRGTGPLPVPQVVRGRAGVLRVSAPRGRERRSEQPCLLRQLRPLAAAKGAAPGLRELGRFGSLGGLPREGCSGADPCHTVLGV